MFDNVVVGVDEGEGGRDAVALARTLAGEGAELTLVNVTPTELLPSRGSRARFDSIERQRLHEMLGKVSRDAGISAKLRSFEATTVGRGLHVYAESHGADLLVIGSTRRSLFGRVLIGDDTRQALNGAPCAVAIAPTGYCREAALVRDVGVGYDGSPESEHALGVARELARKHSAKLSAFEAVSVPAYVYLGPSAVVDPDMIEGTVERAKARIGMLGGVDAYAAYGDAVEELTLYSASVDLLVVGSRGYGPLGRVVHGSTAQHLARTARCPLLVLTRAARVQMPIDDDEAASETAAVAGVPG
jgi:nucleotide-binding universal stress UspA family protein